jgi:hypothetical protein
LALNAHVAPSSETMGIFHLFHPFVEVEFSPFVDFYPEMEVILDWEIFISTLVHSSHIFSQWPISMVDELLQDCFVLNDYVNGFDLF